MMNKVVVSLGSNSTDRAERMSAALEWLASGLQQQRDSGVYETPEFSGRYPDYLNCVASGFTPLDFYTLNSRLKEYERASGRTPASKVTGIVPIDLDIVVFNGEVLRPGEFSRDYFTIGYRLLQ